MICFRDHFELATYYFNSGVMMITLLLSPLLTGQLLSSQTSLSLDLQRLPMPRRWWMVWLSALLVMIGSAIDNTLYAVDLADIQMLSKASICLSVIPNLLLTLVYCVVQVSTIMVSSSILTYLIIDFDAIQTTEITSGRFMVICETFEILAERLSPLYLLFFSTSSASVMLMSFYLYFYWGSIATSIFSITGMLHGILVLGHLAFIADDCHGSIRKLHLHLR